MTTAIAPRGRHRQSWQGSGVLTQVLVLTKRSLLAVVRDPRIVIFSLLQPLMMLVLFSQVFSSIAATPGFPTGLSYINYLMPSILVTTTLGAAMGAGVGLVTDMKNGVLARFRSLPIRLGSVLFARSFSDLVRTAIQLVLMVIVSVVFFGFDPAGGPAGIAAAFGLSLIVGWGLGWVFIALGGWLRNAEVMQLLGFLLMFPLMFVSSAYLPVQNLPAWLRAVADVNPMTYAINAARNLCLAAPVGTEVISAVAISIGLAIIGGTLAVKGFRKPM